MKKIFFEGPDLGATQDGDNDDVQIIDTYDSEALKKFALEQAAQKKHWKNKFMKSQTLETKAPEAPSLPKDDVKPEVKPAETSFDSLAEITSVIRDLADDELQDLRAQARELGVDPVKFIRSKAGQSHLKELRSAKKTADTTPSPSNKVVTFNGKPVDSVLTDSNASKEDKQRAFEAKIRGSRGSNQSI